MAKEDIKRSDIKDRFLKKIVVRLDFVGVTDVTRLTRLFDDKFPKKFTWREEYYNNNIGIREEDLKQVSETLSIPVKVLEKVKVFRYKELRQATEKADLDISQFFISLTINCDENYDGIDKYLEYFKGAITVFSNKLQYFSPRRLGLRKIRIQNFSQIQDSESVFESFVFKTPNYNITQPKIRKTTYYDYLESSKEGQTMYHNIRREINRGINQEGNQQYKLILDIDTYITDQEGLTPSNAGNLIVKANDREFNIYKSCMNLDYLENIGE